MNEMKNYPVSGGEAETPGNGLRAEARFMDQESFNRHYRLNPCVKQKPELRDENILLSVRHLKQY